MAFGREWYERRKEISQNKATGAICDYCKFEVMLDTTTMVPFCGCGYHEPSPVSTGAKLFIPKKRELEGCDERNFSR
jgi:hypothetical protein